MTATKPPAGERVSGHVALLFPSAYIKAADLHGRDVTVTIDYLVREKVTMQGGKSEQKIVARMKYPDGRPIAKGWILNKTNAKAIGAVLGSPDVGTWAGKKVTIFGTTCRGADGSQVECIRVRARVNDRADASQIPDDMAKAPEEREPGSDG